MRMLKAVVLTGCTSLKPKWCKAILKVRSSTALIITRPNESVYQIFACVSLPGTKPSARTLAFIPTIHTSHTLHLTPDFYIRYR